MLKSQGRAVNVRVDPDIYDAIKDRADLLDMSVSAVIRQLLTRSFGRGRAA
jgi:hypothetical protein